MSKPFFNPEVKEYFILNGFQLPAAEPLPNGMLFIKGNVSVQFWNNKIEVRHNNSVHWNLYKSYTGFDGQNIFHLMLLMHLMDVINLRDVKKEVFLEEVEKLTSAKAA